MSTQLNTTLGLTDFQSHYVCIDSICIGLTKDQMDYLPQSVVKIEHLKDGRKQPTDFQRFRYLQVTGKPMKKKRSGYRIYILNYDNGQSGIATQKQRNRRFVLEFHGLQQYNADGSITENALLRRQMAYEIMKHAGTFTINRVDGAYDDPYIPLLTTDKIIGRKRLARAHPRLQTIYFETRKQRGKEHPRIKVTLYNKADKNKLPFLMERLELSLKSACWAQDEVSFEDFEAIVATKIRKAFKYWTDMDVELQGLNSTRAYTHAQPVNDTHSLSGQSLLRQLKSTGRV